MKRDNFLKQGLVTPPIHSSRAIHLYQTFRRVKNIASKLPKRRTEQVLAVLGLMACENHLVSHSLVSAGLLIHRPPTILIDTRVWSRSQRVGIRKAQVEASSGHRIKSSFAEAIRATVERVNEQNKSTTPLDHEGMCRETSQMPRHNRGEITAALRGIRAA